MANAKVVFLHGLHQKVVDAIISFNPAGFTTVVVSGKDPEEIQIDAISDADFIAGTLSTSFMERLLSRPTPGRLAEAV